MSWGFLLLFTPQAGAGAPGAWRSVAGRFGAVNIGAV